MGAGIKSVGACLLAAAVAGAPLIAEAEIIGVAVDSKVALVDGEAAVVPGPAEDTVVFFDFREGEPRKLGAVAAPTSYLGAPATVAITADGTLALATASFSHDPADPGRIVYDDRLTVIDLSGPAPEVLQTLSLGASPSSVKIHPSGRMALVPSNPDNSITLLSIDDKRVSIVDRIEMAENMGPLVAAFAPDGAQALVTQASGQRVSLFDIRDDRLRLPVVRDMVAGVTPFTPSYCGTSGFAVVANFGIPGEGNGDVDTASLIDLRGETPRVIDTISVGSAPEDAVCSPDGRYAAFAVQNMSNRPEIDPLHSPHSLVVVLEIENGRLRHFAEMPFGAWAQGIVFLGDSRTIVTQSIVDRSLHVFRIGNDALQRVGSPIAFENGAPVGLGVAGR